MNFIESIFLLKLSLHALSGPNPKSLSEYKKGIAFTIPFLYWSGRRDSDPRHLPWQGNALPLSHSRIQLLNII